MLVAVQNGLSFSCPKSTCFYFIALRSICYSNSKLPRKAANMEACNSEIGQPRLIAHRTRPVLIKYVTATVYVWSNCVAVCEALSGFPGV